ncbi:hypothetical protein FCM35_KLT00323 [Carex littledalei]|uniref:MATH domain-containing protein n=1 Tax=Carex littledalei TaxID=544730 RepID=A0A833VTH5_9POAL|nr:hypothetical protein FCM35_KLT00323 [Carex littledalei]
MKSTVSLIDASVEDPIEPEKEVICDMETFSMVYRAKINRYSKVKCCPPGFWIDCGTFDLAGHLWAISYYPKVIGIPQGVALQIRLLTNITTSLKLKVKVSLIDPSGRRLVVADIRRQIYDKMNDGLKIPFMQKTKLDSSEYVKDDCLTFECIVSVTKWSPAEVVKKKPQSAITFSNTQEDSGEETDFSIISGVTLILD